MSKHREVLRVLCGCVFKFGVKIAQSHGQQRQEKPKGALWKTKYKKHKSLFSPLPTECPHFSSMTIFITQLCIPCPFGILALFCVSWRNAPCSPIHLPLQSVFLHTELLQGLHQQPRWLLVLLLCWKQRLRDFLLERTRRPFNLLKKEGAALTPTTITINLSVPALPPPSSSSAQPHTLHGSEAERCQVSLLFTWTQGNVKVCLVWPQVRTISFLTQSWFTWPPLTCP